MQTLLHVGLQKVLHQHRHHLRSYSHYVWTRRYVLVVSCLLILLLLKLLLHLWYVKLPEDQPSIMCSFGRGKK